MTILSNIYICQWVNKKNHHSHPWFCASQVSMHMWLNIWPIPKQQYKGTFLLRAILNLLIFPNCWKNPVMISQLSISHPKRSQFSCLFPCSAKMSTFYLLLVESMRFVANIQHRCSFFHGFFWLRSFPPWTPF